MRSHHSSSRQPDIHTATHNFRNASPKSTFYIPNIAPTSVSHHGTPQNNTAQTFYLGHESRDAVMNLNLQHYNANDKSAGSQRGLRQHKRNYSDSTNNNSLVNRLADYSHRGLPESSQEARSRRHQEHGTLDDNTLRLKPFLQNGEEKNTHNRHVEYNSGRNPVKPVLNIDFSSVINKHNEEVPLDHKLNKSSHGSKASLTHELDKENQPVKANKSSSHDHAKAASKLYKTTNPSSILPKYGESSYNTTSIPKRDSYIHEYETTFSSPQNQLSSYMSSSTRMNEVKASGSHQLTSDIRSTSRASTMKMDDMGQLLSQDKSDTTAKRSQNSDSYSFKDIKKHMANYGMPVKIGLDLAGYANSSNNNDAHLHDKTPQNYNTRGNHIGDGFENDTSLVNFGTDADIVPQPVQIVPQLKSSTNKASVYSSLHAHEDSQTKDSLSAFDKTGYIARHSHLSMNNRRSDQSDEKFNATAPHSRPVHSSKRERDELPKRHQEETHHHHHHHHHMEIERYRKDNECRKSDPVKAEKKLHDLLNPSRRHDERSSSGSRHKRSKSTTAKLRSHSKIVNQKKSFAEDFFVSLVERNKSAGYEGDGVGGSHESFKMTPLKDELILAALHENRDRTKSKGRSEELIQISNILQHASTPEYTKGGDMRHNMTSSSRHYGNNKDHLLSGSGSLKGDKTMEGMLKRDESGNAKMSHQEMKENYKKSVRRDERHSHAQSQADKGNLKRIASQPEELKKFAMQLVRDKMQENKKDKGADTKQKYDTDKLKKTPQSRDFQDRSTPQSVKHAKAVPFALFDLGRKEKEEPKEEARTNKHAGIETYSIVDKTSEERKRYRSREEKYDASKDKDRKSQEAGMSKTYKKDMQLENVSKAAYSSVGSSKREVKMSPRLRQENTYVSKHDSASHASHSKKEMSDSRKGPVDSIRDKENLYRHSKPDSGRKKSKESKKYDERNQKHKKEEPIMPTNISYLLSSEHNTSIGNMFNCEATILDKNPLSEFTETEELPSKWLGDKLLVPDHLLDVATLSKPKQAMTPSASQAKIVPHHTKQKSVGDHVMQIHADSRSREVKGGRYSYQDPESSNRREESGSQTRHAETRVIDTQAHAARPVIVKDGWLGGPIGAEETPRYQASQRERHEEKVSSHYMNSYEKQYSSAGVYKEIVKSNKGTPKVDMLSQISKNTRDQKPGMPPKSGLNQASQANISCAMDYQSNDVYVARREKDNELAKKFDEFKAKEMSNHAGLKERRTSREEKANKYGVGKHGLQELNSYDSTPFLLANFDNYMSNTSQREQVMLTGRTIPHVVSHQGTVQKRPNYQLQIPSAERYLDAGVTGKRDVHVKPHVEHEKREESKSGYTQTTRYKPEGDLFDESFLQHSFKPASKDYDGPQSNMASHRKGDLLEGISHLSAIEHLSDDEHIEISDKRPDSRYASKERKVESRKPKQIEVANPSHESYTHQPKRKGSGDKYIDLVRMTSPKENGGMFAKTQDKQNEVIVVPKITDRLDDKLSPKVRLFDNFSGGTLREKRIPQYEKAQKAMHISAVSTPKDAEGSMRRERFIKDKTGLDVFTIGRVGASTGRNRSRQDISIKSPMGMSGKDSILYDQSNHSQTQKNSSVVKKNTVGFSRPSNKQMIKNALNHVCLAGEVNRREREDVMIKIDEDKDRNNFIIVFKDLSGRQDLRALYSFDTTSGYTKKLYANGSAPVQLEESLISAYYRYDSGAREFKLIPDNKTLSIVVDAVSLHPYMSRKISQ